MPWLAHIDSLVAYAFGQFHTAEPLTPARLISSLRQQYHPDIVPDTLRNILLGNPRLKPIMEWPIEAERVDPSSQATSEYFTRLSALLEGVSLGFLWNMDKLDRVGWPDAHTETGCVPALISRLGDVS
jgi:hypothetical protein